jgi:hypothetical protein
MKPKRNHIVSMEITQKKNPNSFLYMQLCQNIQWPIYVAGSLVALSSCIYASSTLCIFLFSKNVFDSFLSFFFFQISLYIYIYIYIYKFRSFWCTDIKNKFLKNKTKKHYFYIFQNKKYFKKITTITISDSTL